MAVTPSLFPYVLTPFEYNLWRLYIKASPQFSHWVFVVLINKYIHIYCNNIIASFPCFPSSHQTLLCIPPCLLSNSMASFSSLIVVTYVCLRGSWIYKHNLLVCTVLLVCMFSRLGHMGWDGKLMSSSLGKTIYSIFSNAYVFFHLLPALSE